MERKVRVGAAKDGDEMIFERPNGAFGGVSFSASLSDVVPIAAIVMQSRAKVPAGGAVAGVGFADRGILMHNDFGAEGTKWRLVKVEGAMELGVGVQVWVDARGAEKIEVRGHPWIDGGDNG